MLGYCAYADSSRLMNDNIRAFQGEASRIQSINKQLKAQAGQKADLDTLRNLGEEFAIKTTKDLVSKYSSKMIGDAIGGDTDKLLGSYVDKGLDKVFSSGTNVPPPLSSGADTLPSTRMALSGNPEIDTIRVNNLYQRSLNNSGVPIDTQNVGKDTSEVNIAKPSADEIEMTSGTNTGAVAKDVSADVAEDVGADVAGEVGTEEALQATAGIFGASGVLAPLGGALEVGADLFALFEGAKTTADFVGRDILHTNAPLQYDKQLVPTMPQTLAQKGLSVNPSMDTYDLPHNTASVGW